MTAQSVFTPRRIGHVNLFVSDVEAARDFYEGVCGIKYVFFENDIRMAFMSNGSSHHDVGLMQAMNKARIGRDGYVQPSTGRGEAPGLNHLAFEMESEAELVGCYERALAAGLTFHGTTDHQISRSIYVFDPDMNLLEFYADMMEDWQRFYRENQGAMISGAWDPQANAPDTAARYVKRFEPAHVEQAPLHPKGLIGAGLYVSDLERSVRFYQEIVGLRLLQRDPAAALLETPVTGSRLTLVLARGAEMALRLHHASFEVADRTQLAAARSRGVRVKDEFAAFGWRSLVIEDADGYQLEFRCPDPAAEGRAVPAGFAAA